MNRSFVHLSDMCHERNPIFDDFESSRYAVYKTRVGLALHQRTCAECTRPHSESISVPILANVHITVVPILHDNYGPFFLGTNHIFVRNSKLTETHSAYLIVDEQSRTCLAVDPAGDRRNFHADNDRCSPPCLCENLSCPTDIYLSLCQNFSLCSSLE